MHMPYTVCVCVSFPTSPHLFFFGFLTEVVALLATPLLFGFTECLARYPYGPELPDYTALLLVRIFGSGVRNAHVLFIASAQDFSIYERSAGVASCTGEWRIGARIELAALRPGARRATN